MTSLSYISVPILKGDGFSIINGDGAFKLVSKMIGDGGSKIYLLEGGDFSYGKSDVCP